MSATIPADLHRRPDRADRADRADRIVGFLRGHPLLLPGLLGGVVATGLAYTAWQDPNGDGVFPRCTFSEVTGLDCVGCGGLRAVHALTHGHVLTAADHNLFVTVALPLVLVAWGLWVRSARGGPASPLARLRWPVWAAFGVSALLFGVVRNIGGVPLFTYLGSA